MASNYRKIYKKHYGPIPCDSYGRSYEIHHIDGNHNNNDPKNLIAITLQEHYDIHYAQGDWSACYYMSIQRMNKTPAELSDLSKKIQLERVKNGTHHFLEERMGQASQQIVQKTDYCQFNCQQKMEQILGKKEKMGQVFKKI